MHFQLYNRMFFSHCCVCRAGRLTDGPYTSYDLNTLLQATAGERRAVVIDQGTECFHIVAIISFDFFVQCYKNQNCKQSQYPKAVK